MSSTTPGIARCTIVPPHMFEHLSRSRDPALRDVAERALYQVACSEWFRGHRCAIGGIAPLAGVSTGTMRRSVYDAGGLERLPGTLVRAEGDPATGDPAEAEAYDGAGATYGLFRDVYERNSIDDLGMRLVSTIHYGRDYDNAFWDGKQMVYGDGDGILFRRFTAALDVIGHELTHGVTQFEANLDYAGQPGALNESMSDVFGSLVRQRALGQAAAQADWLVGAGLFTDRVKGRALRSMAAPGTAYDDPELGRDPQPAHMRDYVDTDADSGGVHINSGIPNRAFHLAAVAIGGRAWDHAGRIWYVTLRDRLRPRSDFADAARLTADVAAELYGPQSREADAVRDAWKQVGL